MSVSRPRGPLPARVYWFRRLLVLGVLAALVVGIAQLLGTGSDGSSGPTAQQASSTTVDETASAAPSVVSTADAKPQADRTTKAGKKPAKKKTRTPLPMPTGPCQDSDVRVQPAPKDTRADDQIELTLRLSTFESPACSWEVSPDSVVVRLTSGSDRIWSSQDCQAAVPTRSVVLRRKTPVELDVIWSGRRSDSDCSSRTDWAEPGYYHLASAAMGSEPESEQFRLLPPAPITETPKPTPRVKDKKKTEDEADEKAERRDRARDRSDG